jgi:hypothetical protein
MFGKRNRPAPPEQPRPDSSRSPSGAGPGGTPPAAEARLPWAGDPSSIACNLAAGNLANNLAAWVEHEGRVHAESYVAASGAIAGYAAQQTLKAQGPAAALHVVTTTADEKYLFGDPLNDMLLAKTQAEADGRVWSRATGAAISVGLPVSRIPSLDDMFGHVAKSLGGPLEGLPSTGAAHQPAVAVRQLLAIFWPRVEQLFKADFDDLHRRFGPAPPRWWCAIAAYATARPIMDVANVLDPATSLTILMESAIYASKLTRL